MTTENTVDIDTANAEFERFTDAMDLDVDTSEMDTEDLAAFNKVKKRLLNAVINGSLVFNDDGEAVYTPRHSKSKHKDAITFHERTGASLMAMDNKKKNEDVKKTYAVMASMSGLHPNTFAGLVGIDIKICEGIFSLLMD